MTKFGKISALLQKYKSLGNFLNVYLLFWNILNQLWHILIAVNGPILKKSDHFARGFQWQLGFLMTNGHQITVHTICRGKPMLICGQNSLCVFSFKLTIIVVKIIRHSIN